MASALVERGPVDAAILSFAFNLTPCNSSGRDLGSAAVGFGVATSAGGAHGGSGERCVAGRGDRPASCGNPAAGVVGVGDDDDDSAAAAASGYHHDPLHAASLALSCLYAVFLFPVGVVGNSLIMAVNVRARERGRLRRKLSVPDLYFVNLAAADLILVLGSPIEVFNVHTGYYDAPLLCAGVALCLQVSLYSSVFFLTWMSVDRCVALSACGGRAGRAPMRRSQTARVACALIWVASVLATFLPLAASQLRWRQDSDANDSGGSSGGGNDSAASGSSEPRFCFAESSASRWLEVTLGFAVPFAIMAACYALIARALRGARDPILQGGRPSLPRRRHRKALRMIVAVVVVFFVCWLPENAVVFVSLLDETGVTATGRDPRYARYYPLLRHAVNLMAFSNSCLNPVVYGFLGETFRHKLRERKKLLVDTCSSKRRRMGAGGRGGGGGGHLVGHISRSERQLYTVQARQDQLGHQQQHHQQLKLQQCLVAPSEILGAPSVIAIPLRIGAMDVDKG
ncbi:G-protein coupled estrogen receptor 1 [Lethenteron reissneri]|uniref:G-protein coupled estrogen receptor 1 n=1 Tax=Lethenteron reissneri TaxID=7753 RepID=UPI002AB6BCB1|nr:G-protein coupled estrogen receptor 1 [Lethenteron reissneri]